MLDIDLLVESGGLYVTALPSGESFSWRLLTLKEYRIFRALRESGAVHPYLLHDQVFDRCYQGIGDLVDPLLPAGIFVAMGELIMWLSGDCAGSTQVEDIMMARQAYPAESVHEHMKRVVLLAFPSYTLEDIEDWARPEFIRKFTISEALLVNRGIGYEPLDPKHILTPEQQAKRKQRADIDFRRENRELGSAMSGGEGHHPMDLPPDVFARKMKIAEAMEARRNRQR